MNFQPLLRARQTLNVKRCWHRVSLCGRRPWPSRTCIFCPDGGGKTLVWISGTDVTQMWWCSHTFNEKRERVNKAAFDLAVIQDMPVIRSPTVNHFKHCSLQMFIRQLCILACYSEQLTQCSTVLVFWTASGNWSKLVDSLEKLRLSFTGLYDTQYEEDRLRRINNPECVK